MRQKRGYKQYSKEFKEEAVALIRDQGYSVAEASKSLGVAIIANISGILDNYLKYRLSA